ncbi:MAG: exodeoxyribonuclease VII small subunit [Sediminispirochaetaceae bacterium]
MKNFEERLTRLEELNEKMKSGNIPLDEAVGMFEEGIKLARGLEKDLSKVERKIEILVNEPETPEEEANLELFGGKPGGGQNDTYL